MKINVRNKTFETNSSSVHTLVISAEGLEPSNLPINKEGYIEATYGKFGKDGEIYDGQANKLSYLLTQCYYLGGWEYQLDRESNYHFRYVEEAICDYTGAKGILIVGGEPEIDHQSHPEYELRFVNEWYKKSIQNFVFNKYIALSCDCD